MGIRGHLIQTRHGSSTLPPGLDEIGHLHWSHSASDGRTHLAERLLLRERRHRRQRRVSHDWPKHPIPDPSLSPSTVRVWDIAGTEQILKLEIKALGGKINDLAWDGESKRIIVVGEGREKCVHRMICFAPILSVVRYRFGATFSVDTGSSVGEIIGTSQVRDFPTSWPNVFALNPPLATRRSSTPSQSVLSARSALQPPRTTPPSTFSRACRSSTTRWDSYQVLSSVHLRSSPQTIRSHTKYVQDVCYCPSGDYFASVGSDGKLFVYDGKDGSTLEQADAHKGTVVSRMSGMGEVGSALSRPKFTDGLCVECRLAANRHGWCRWLRPHMCVPRCQTRAAY